MLSHKSRSESVANRLAAPWSPRPVVVGQAVRVAVAAPAVGSAEPARPDAAAAVLASVALAVVAWVA